MRISLKIVINKNGRDDKQLLEKEQSKYKNYPIIIVTTIEAAMQKMITQFVSSSQHMTRHSLQVLQTLL